jgi:hypothetical protein
MAAWVASSAGGVRLLRLLEGRTFQKPTNFPVLVFFRRPRRRYIERTGGGKDCF